MIKFQYKGKIVVADEKYIVISNTDVTEQMLKNFPIKAKSIIDFYKNHVLNRKIYEHRIRKLSEQSVKNFINKNKLI